MQPIAHIAYAIDFFTVAERVARCSAQIAKQLCAELHLIFEVNPTDLPFKPEFFFGYQKCYKQKILTDQYNNRMLRKVVTRYPATEICARTTPPFADLIVISRLGKSGIQNRLLDIVSKDVFPRTSYDVIATNQHHDMCKRQAHD